LTVFNLGMGEITVILLLALIFLGPKKLPELASGLGKIIKDIRKATSDVKNEIQLDEAIRKPFEELRDAVTLPPEELKRRDRLQKELEEARRRAEEDIKALAAKAGQETGATDAAPGAAEPDSPTVAFDGQATAADTAPNPVAPLPEPGAARRSSSGIPTVKASGPGSGPLFPPPGTIPATPGKEKVTARGLAGPARAAHGPVVVASAPVPPPATTTADRTNTTQFLSEADLMPPSAAPPPIPPGSGKHPAVAPPPPPPAKKTEST